MMTKNNSFFVWLDKHAEEAVLLICLLIITVLTTVNVVLRYVFNLSLTWSEEICKLCLVTSGFYSLGYCIRFKTMIRVDALVQLMGKKVGIIFENTTWIFMTVFFIFLLSGALKVVGNSFANAQINPALQIPAYITYAIPLSGCFVAVFRIFQLLYFTIFELLHKGE